MATAVCKAIQTQYPGCKIIVITGYPDVFIGNPWVYKTVMEHELAYFYREHYMDQPDTQFFMLDPYLSNAFIRREGHLIKVWCEMNGIKYNGELPEIYLNHKEKTSFSTLFRFPKPIFLIQPFGGTPNQTDKYSWPRDLPYNVAQNVVNAYAATHTVVQICRRDQHILQHVVPVEVEFRALCVLIAMSQKRLLIDSCGQHIAAALGLPSVVCWIANVPSQFGYDMHTNIVANPPTQQPELRNAILSMYNTMGFEKEFPYANEEEIFDIAPILAGLGHDAAQPVGNGQPVKQRLTNPAPAANKKSPKKKR